MLCHFHACVFQSFCTFCLEFILVHLMDLSSESNASYPNENRYEWAVYRLLLSFHVSWTGNAAFLSSRSYHRAPYRKLRESIAATHWPTASHDESELNYLPVSMLESFELTQIVGPERGSCHSCFSLYSSSEYSDPKVQLKKKENATFLVNWES